MEIRKLMTVTEDVIIEGGRKGAKPVRRAAAIAVITNPAVGDQSGKNLDQFSGMGYDLGAILGKMACDAIGDGEKVQSYGKGCIVGVDGELEQAAILIHKEFGQSVRESITGGGKAGIPSTKKVGAPGVSIDVPLSFRHNSGLATHFDAMEVSVPGSPKADEIVVALCYTDGGRLHPWDGWK